MPENSYVLSFSYDTKAENVFHINSLYDGRLFLKVFRHIKAYNDKNISVFVTNAGRHTVSNLLVLKNMGFRQVFCDKNLDKVITAHTKEFLQNKFSIDFTTDVMSDIEKTL